MFLLLLFFLFISCIFFSIKLTEKKNPSEFFLLFLVFFYTQILTFSTILGIFKFLTLKNLTVLSFISFLISILIYRKEKILIQIKTLSLHNIILFSFFLSICLFSIIQIILLPPLTTDGLLYHLPFAVHFLKSRSISIYPLYFGDIAMSYYPVGGEIFYFFTLLSGKNFLLKFTQLPFLIMGMLSVFLISRKLSVTQFSAVVSCILFSLIKPVFKEASLCFVDLMMTSCFLSSIYFLLKDEKKYIFPALCSISILISVKTLSLIWLILLIPLFFKKRQGHFRKIFLFLSTFVIFSGFFSYIRNIILTGNPFYPAEIKLGNFTLFNGLYSYKRFFSPEQLRIFLYPQSHIDAPPSALLLLFTFLCISVFIYFWKYRKISYIFLLPFLMILSYFIFIPPCYYQIRHLLPFYGILSIGTVYPLDRPKLKWMPLLFAGWFFLLIFPYRQISNFLFFLTLFVIFCFTMVIIKKYPALLFIIISLFLLYFLGYLFPFASSVYEEKKFEIWKMFYTDSAEIWEFIGKKQNKNIAYVGEFFLYPLFGKNFSNNLYYQSVNSVETKPVHLYNGTVNFPEENPGKIYRKNPSFDLWITGLRAKKIDMILMKKDNNYIEKNWIEKNPYMFEKIFSGPFAEVYKVKLNNYFEK